VSVEHTRTIQQLLIGVTMIRFLHQLPPEAVSLFFVIQGGGFTFPRPLTDFGWTSDQQDFIATTLEYCGLEFWPFDCNL